VWSVDAFYRAVESERAEGAETMELPIHWSELTVLDRIRVPQEFARNISGRNYDDNYRDYNLRRVLYTVELVSCCAGRPRPM
jgi:hypothetical protein